MCRGAPTFARALAALGGWPLWQGVILVVMTAADHMSNLQAAREQGRHLDRQLTTRMQALLLLASAGLAATTQASSMRVTRWDHFVIMAPLAVAFFACAMGQLTNQCLVPNRVAVSGSVEIGLRARNRDIARYCVDSVIRENRYRKHALFLSSVAIAVAFLNFSLWIFDGASPAVNAAAADALSALRVGAVVVVVALFLRWWWNRSTGPYFAQQAELLGAGHVLDLEGGHVTVARLDALQARVGRLAGRLRAWLRRLRAVAASGGRSERS